MVELYEHQRKALLEMHNGCILCGGVGSGKSITALTYYHCIECGGRIKPRFEPMAFPKNLYIITTARKRDTREWQKEAISLLIGSDIYPTTKFIVDSWNNIEKYVDVKDAFFIFDEQRVVGAGAWVKSFLKITKANRWVLLSATPGDTWMDYVPVFIANGFFKNRTEFRQNHVVYNHFSKFPKVDRYINTGRLVRLRRAVLVNMEYERDIQYHKEYVTCNYDSETYKAVVKNRWDPFKNEPIQNASGLCYILRQVVGTDTSRAIKLLELIEQHPKVVIFYNYDYELDFIKKTLSGTEVEVAEWNGHKHQPIPDSISWAYLVQYNAGAEGWNCTKTDTIIFFSVTYSYKMMVQAAGRIDRINTPYSDLYYYYMNSKAPIDTAIKRALASKKRFNEERFVRNL